VIAYTEVKRAQAATPSSSADKIKSIEEGTGKSGFEMSSKK
jgi:hypothetical protein